LGRRRRPARRRRHPEARQRAPRRRPRHADRRGHPRHPPGAPGPQARCKRDRPGGVPAGMATGRSGRARIAIAAMALALVAVKWTAPAAAASADAHDHTALRIAYTPRVFHFTSNKDYVDWNHIVAVEYVTP